METRTEVYAEDRIFRLEVRTYEKQGWAVRHISHKTAATIVVYERGTTGPVKSSGFRYEAKVPVYEWRPEWTQWWDEGVRQGWITWTHAPDSG